MKKLLCMICCLCLLVPAAVSAERKVITALASEINPGALASVSVNALVRSYNREDNTMTVELIIPETYDAYETESLQVGDAIYTKGQEVTIENIVKDYGDIILNQRDPEDPTGTIMLYQDSDLNYRIMADGDHTWTSLGTVKIPVSDRMLFLDGISPSTGESLDLPAVRSLREFVAELEGTDIVGPGFAQKNVTVVIDEYGTLALVQRFYVPWQ